MITLEHISKRFKKLIALDDISAYFEAGNVISLIGPNGCGKTTLIKSILGMVRPDSGKIIVNGCEVNKDYTYRNQIGYMPQIGRFPDNMKLGGLFNMLKYLRGATEADLDLKLYLEFGLDKIIDKPMRTLSGGTRQKVSAAIAFLFKPEILILDEPTASLDPLSSEMLKSRIIKEKNQNKLILISSHILSDLDDLTTHIMYMHEGKQLFFKPLEELQLEAGEQKLSKVIAYIMQKNQEKFHRQAFSHIAINN